MPSYNSGSVNLKDLPGRINRDFSLGPAGLNEAQKGALAQAILEAWKCVEVDERAAHNTNVTVVASVTPGAAFSLTIS
jgi:hypothetical protein